MIRKIIAVVFALMMTVSLIWLGAIAGQEKASSRDNREAVQLAKVTSAVHEAAAEKMASVNVYTDTEIDKLKLMDITPLQKVNEDVMGWIHIPDTDINYPLLRGGDNEHYLKHNWKNEPNAAGAIFMEHENAADFSDFNTIIYGHNMRSGSMFGGLKEYDGQAYWETHPYIYILHDNGVFRYDIFAAHRVKPGTITYAMQIKDSRLRAEFISYALDNSQIHAGIQPAVGDRIITLSTCTGDSAFRWVVQGVLNGEQSYYSDVP